jgi:hypothetical protein
VPESRAAGGRLIGAGVDPTASPQWRRTGYKYFPYAAWESRQWWVLRANHCFPEHDLVTLFVDGAAVGDVTASPHDTRPLVVGIAALDPILPLRKPGIPAMPLEQAESAIATVADYVCHGSEFDPPDVCDLCEFAGRDPYERDLEDG